MDTHIKGPAVAGQGAISGLRGLQTLKAKSSDTLTSDATLATDGDTVTIGGKVYTLKTNLTPTEGEVLLGGTVAAQMLNLARAINHTGTPDTDYKVAAANPDVTATSTATTVVVTLIPSRAAKGSVALTEASTHLSWGGGAASGLVPGTTTTVGDRVLLRTHGASFTTPLFIELLEVQDIAFDGTTPIVSIISTNVDGTGGTTNEFVIADLSAGQAPKTRMITRDKIYSVRYTAATGSPTVGNIYSFAKVVGLGPTS